MLLFLLFLFLLFRLVLLIMMHFGWWIELELFLLKLIYSFWLILVLRTTLFRKVDDKHLKAISYRLWTAPLNRVHLDNYIKLSEPRLIVKKWYSKFYICWRYFLLQFFISLIFFKRKMRMIFWLAHRSSWLY